MLNRKIFLCLAVTFAVAVTLHLSPFTLPRLWAGGPNFIAKQGQIRVAGQPANGQKTMTFRLNTDATGTGTVVWSKIASVYCINGMFNYPLSTDDSLVKISDLDFANQQYYMSMQLEGGAEMMPREPIAAIPYAFAASTANCLRGNGHIRITGAGDHYITNGNVGIGIQTPDQKLTVDGNISQTGTIISSGTENNYFAGNIGIGISNPSSKLQVLGGVQISSNSAVPGDTIVQVSTAANSTLMILKGNGNVGIGTTNPSAKLDLNGTLRLEGSTAGYTEIKSNASPTSYTITLPATAGANNQVLATNGSGTLSWQNNGGGTSTQWTTSGSNIYYNTGNVGIGITNPSSPLHVYGNSSSPAVYIQQGGSGAKFQVGSSGDIYVSYLVGNVGIGNTNPAAKLDVAGGYMRARYDGTNVPPTSGEGVEIMYPVSGCGYLCAYNRTTSQYQTLKIDASSILLNAQSGGNVGIGTTNPTHLLQLTKSHAAATIYNMFRVNFDDNWGLRLQQNYTGTGNIQYDFIERYNTVDYNVLTFKNGNVGIGTTDPNQKLTICDETNSLFSLIEASTVDGAIIRGFRARGTVTSPSQTLAGDCLIGLRGGGYTNSGAYTAAGVSMINTYASQNFTSSAQGTYIGFGTTADNSTSTLIKVVISSGGFVGIGSSNPSPLSRLTLANNVLSGNIDDYNDYQLLLYTGVSAALSYGLAIENNTFDFNSGSGAYKFYRSGSNVTMMMDTNGNVGIGTISPTAKLQVLGGVQISSNSAVPGDTIVQVSTASTNGTLLILKGNGNVGIGTTNPQALLHVAGSAGNATGVWSTVSDIRLKKDIEPLRESLDTLMKLQGVSFYWKDENNGKGLQRGFIAQDVEKIIPEWVKTDADGYKRLEKVGVEALLVEAIKEQQKEIELLKAEIKSLKTKFIK